MIGYFDIWRAVKGLHIRSFNMDSRDVENVILRIVKLKERDLISKKQAVGDLKIDELNNNVDISEDFDKNNQEIKRQIKSEIFQMAGEDS